MKFQSDRASPTFGPCSAISFKASKRKNEKNEGEILVFPKTFKITFLWRFHPPLNDNNPFLLKRPRGSA